MIPKLVKQEEGACGLGTGSVESDFLFYFILFTLVMKQFSYIVLYVNYFEVLVFISHTHVVSLSLVTNASFTCYSHLCSFLNIQWPLKLHPMAIRQ